MKLRRIFNIISASFAFVTLLLSLSSCSDDSLNSDAPDGDNEVRLFVKISTAVPSSREAGQGDQPIPIEQMHSCRLIMIDKSGKVEKNIYAKLDDPGDSHDFGNGDDVYNMIITTSGEKRFFLVANEESVGEDWYSEGNVVTPTSNQTFTDWLSKNLELVTDPASALNSIVFTPYYSRETGIPMSSFYEVELKPGKETLVFYLVRVATKFQLNFKNYRNEEVKINSVSINQIANSNFFFPKIDISDQYKEDIFWIDWLRLVSQETGQSPDIEEGDSSNEKINSKWGWITKYTLPIKSEHKPIPFNSEILEIPKGTGQTATTPIPGELSTKPFYFPESKFIGENGSQKYTLEFNIQRTKDDPVVLTSEIVYLKSLFRNTYVIVNIEMSTASEDIYAEIRQWTWDEPSTGIIEPEL